MQPFPEPFDITRLKVFPLAERASMATIEETLVPAGRRPPAAM